MDSRAGEQRRRASVVVPTLNGARTIATVLDALISQQAPFEFEIVVSDNGSTDETRQIVESFAHAAVPVKLVDASAVRGAPYARNRGAQEATGDLIVMCDDDDLPADGWLAGLARALEDSDIVGGALEVEMLNLPDTIAWRADSDLRGLVTIGFLPTGYSCNFGVRRDVFEAIGGFDESMAHGEDLDIFWRAQLAGFRAGFADDAVVHYRHRRDLRSAAKQSYRHAMGTAHAYRIHRSQGMRKRPVPYALKQSAWLLLHVAELFQGSARRGRWVWLAASNAGRVRGSIRYRVLYL